MAPAMFVCASCKKPLPKNGKCCVEHQFTSNGLSYNPDPLLSRAFPKKFRLYRALQNNGEIAYRTLAEDSLSLPKRQDVADFGAFIRSHIQSGRVLDIGCGPLRRPGYLVGTDFELYGLDPMPCTDFDGVGVTGAAEFLPFADEHFEALVFATSIDHVCSLERTAQEAFRVLKPKGKVLIWMGDRSEALLQRLIFKLKQIGLSLRDGYRHDRWKVYPNGSVFYIPPGAVDQFHTFRETPALIERLFKRAGLAHLETRAVDYGTGKQAFLAFER
jgi:SAM-dependent methyltransferase